MKHLKVLMKWNWRNLACVSTKSLNFEIYFLSFPWEIVFGVISGNDVFSFKKNVKMTIKYLKLLWYRFLSTKAWNWRVRWKKGGRYFTQNRTLSKMLQISHAVLFRCLKQCSACFFPEACFLLEILRMRKNTFFRGHPLGTFCWMKNKRTFCFAKRWSHYHTLIIYHCFVSASG